MFFFFWFAFGISILVIWIPLCSEYDPNSTKVMMSKEKVPQDALQRVLLHCWSGKGEEYQLFWPDTPNLVRLAAKANATIVPFSGIGSDECLGIGRCDALLQVSCFPLFSMHLTW